MKMIMIRNFTLTARHGLQIANQGLLQLHHQLHPGKLNNLWFITWRRASIVNIGIEEMTRLTSAALEIWDHHDKVVRLSLEIISAMTAPIIVAMKKFYCDRALENNSEASWHSHVLAMVLPIVPTFNWEEMDEGEIHQTCRWRGNECEPRSCLSVDCAIKSALWNGEIGQRKFYWAW